MGKLFLPKSLPSLLKNKKNLQEKLKKQKFQVQFNMEIILLENILNLGTIGEKVKVKNGYGNKEKLYAIVKKIQILLIEKKMN